MLQDITTGNARKDGQEFRFWFVGQLEEWCKANNMHFDSRRFGLRNSSDIEIKWGIYRKNEVRNIWAPRSDKTAMSILISGDFTFEFREADDHANCREVRLKGRGDYVIWSEDVEHTWRMDEDSEILTIRWTPKASGNE
jgi:cupin superfamily acireductone dioxygenase involved in methionine salvage